MTDVAYAENGDVPDVLIHHGSLRERLAARRRANMADRTFVIPVHGFEEEGFFARYRVMPYEALRRIGERNRRLDGTAEGDIANAADTLIAACVELLEGVADDESSYRSTGLRWGVDAARELFDVELSDGATDRQALREVFAGATGGTMLMLHFRAYDEQMLEAMPELDEATRGNSLASSAP